jgi:hypothetical protein
MKETTLLWIAIYLSGFYHSLNGTMASRETGDSIYRRRRPYGVTQAAVDLLWPLMAVAQISLLIYDLVRVSFRR